MQQSQQQSYAAVLISLIVLAGCATPSPSSPKAETPPATPTLSAEARLALVQAEAAVADARARFALWTPTEAALKSAQAAAQAGDSDTVIRRTGVIAQQIRASLAQLNYPSTEMK
jgi:hypothetical protein